MKNSRLKGLAASLVLSAMAATTAQAHVETTTVRWGPITLPGGSMEDPGEKWNELAGLTSFDLPLFGGWTGLAGYEMNKPCEDCYIVGIHPNMVFENGEVANHNNGVMLHHVVNTNWSEPDITCRPGLSVRPIKALGLLGMGGNQRFFASGNERTGGTMPEGHGYYVSEGDRWGLIYHLMNMNPEPRDVYFEFTFDWVDASEHGEEITPVRPIWADIDQCGDSELDVPAGYSDPTWDWKADRTHDLVAMGGHIHNRGINTAWTNLTKGETLCNSVAGYAPGSTKTPVGPGTGADEAHPEFPNVVTTDPLGIENFMGNISDMTICRWEDNAPTVDKRDEMQVNAQIYTPGADDHSMGIMVGFIKEESCLTNFWCY